MKRRKVAIASSIVFAIIMILGLALVLNFEKYELRTDKFDAVVEFKGEVNLSNLKIYDKISKRVVSVGEFVVVSCDATDTVGDKLLVIEYDDHKYYINFKVKYKVEFVANGEVISTQFVDKADEIVLPEQPEKTGYEFVSWNKPMPSELSGNLELGAVFSSTTLEVPKLEKISVDYGTKLKDITLPSNENGKWIFLNNPESTVGNVENNKEFDVKFVPSTTELVERYNKVSINVKRKELTFKILQDSFVYDGNSHFPTYELPEDVNVTVLGSAKTEVGSDYSYTLMVADSNYSGAYTGKFSITKANVTITVMDKEVNYGDRIEMNYTVAGFDNISLLGISVDLPANLNAGEYDIGATVSNTNVVPTVVPAKLKINKIDLNPAPVDPTLSVINKPAVYGDLLSTVTFEGNYSNGQWVWENENQVIDKIEGYKAIAKFIPKDSNNYNTIIRELPINNIDKKTLQFNVSENVYTYDSKAHTIVYQIENGEYSNLKVNGNISETNAGTYNTTLSIEHEFYKGYKYVSLVINKATPVTDFSAKYTKTWFSGISLENVTLNDGYVWNSSTTSLNTIGTFMFPAKFIPQDTKNYNTVSGEFMVTVDKADSYISGVEYSYNFVYNENEHKISGVQPSQNESSLEYVYFKNGVKVDKLIDFGVYDVTITLPESEHYNSANVTTQVVIEKATVDVVLQSLTATYEDTLGDVKLPVEEDGVWTWKEDLTTSVGNAGEQSHTAIYTPNNSNYKTKEVEAKIKVSKKELNFEILQNVYTYDGNNHSVEYRLLDNFGKVYTNLVIIGNKSSANAGTYNVTLNIESNNYSAIKTVQMVINKARITPEIPSDLTATYLDKLHSVEFPMVQNGVWEWVDNEDTLVGNVGENKFKAVFVVNEQPGLDNFEDYETEVTVNVIKKVVIVPSLTENTAVYTGSKIEAKVNNSDLYIVTSNGWINVGKYTVDFKLNDSNNYIWSNGQTEIAKVDFEITMAQAVISNLVLDGWVYNTKANTPTAVTTFGEIIYSYSTSENGEYVETQPTNAGSYYVKAEVIETENYYGDVKTLAFTIEKATLEVPTVKESVYTGSALQTNLAGTDLYSVQNASGTDVGSYAVVFNITNNNYKWNTGSETSASVNFNIIKAQAEISNFSLVGWTFNEQANTPSSETNFGEVVYTYSTSKDGTFTSVKPTNAGTYYVKAEVFGTGNYYGVEEVTSFTIGKDKIEIPADIIKEFNNTEMSANLVSNQLYTVSNNNKVKDVGKYYITLTIIDGNYKWENGCETSVDVLFEITKSNEVLTNLTLETWRYNESAKTPTVSTKYNSSVVYTYSTSEDGEYVTTQPTDAGTYYVKAEVKGTNNFNGAEAIKEFVISKAQVVSPDIQPKEYIGSSLTAEVEKSDLYNVLTNNGGVDKGSYNVVLILTDFNNYEWEDSVEQTITLSFEITSAVNSWNVEPSINNSWVYGTAVSIPNVTSKFGTVKTEYKKQNSTEEYSETMPTNAGKYLVRFSVAGTDDYSSLSSVLSFEIEKKSIEIPSLDIDTVVTYTGETFVTAIPSTNNYTITNIQEKDAGSYTVVATITNSNYKWETGNETVAEIPFEIQQAETKIENLNMSGWTFGENAESPTSDVNFGTVVYTYSTSKDGEYVATKPTDAGTYYVKAKVEGNSNYTSDEEIFEFTIKKGSANITNFTMSGWTFGGETYSPTGITNFGKVVFTYAKAEEGVYGETKPSDAGSYIVKATVAGTNNYDGDVQTIAFVIKKAKAEIKDFTMSGWTFGGEVDSPTGSTNFGEVAFTYAKAEEGVYSETKPSDAGSYIVKATVAGTNNFDGDEKTINFTISKATVVRPSAGEAKTYALNTTYTTNIEETELYSVQNVSASNAGTYYVTLTLYSSNYIWDNGDETTTQIPFVINQAQAVISNFNLQGWTYDGITQNQPTASSNFGDVKFKYSKTEFGEYTETQITDAGTHYVKAFVENDTNNNYLGTEQTHTYTIEKGKATISEFTMSGWTFGETEASPSASNNLGRIEYVYSTSLNGTYTSGKPTNAGTYYVKAKVSTTNNYTGAITDAIEFTVEKATVVRPNAGEEKTYALNTTYTTNIEETELYSVQNVSASNAGTYYVTLTLYSSNYIWDNGDETTTQIPFIINPAQAVISNFGLTGWTYGDGSSNQPTGTTNFGSIVFTYSTNEAGTNQISRPSDAGTYYITGTVEDDNNYYGATKTQLFVIEQAKTVISDFTMTGWIYGQKEVSPSASANFGTIEYIYSSDETGENVIAKPSNAGTYYVKAYVEGANNYTECTTGVMSYTISKDNPKITAPTYNTLYLSNGETTRNYKTAPAVKDINGASMLTKGTLTYGELTYAHGTNTSYFTLTFTPNDLTNYTVQSVKVNLTVQSVAKIDTTYFATIENALNTAVSGNTVIVMAQTTDKVKILSDSAVIKSGVTLVLPYDANDGRCSDGKAKDEFSNTEAGQKANTNDLPLLSLQNKVIMAAGSKLTIAEGGVLEVAGELSGANGGSAFASHTARNYAELVMEAGAEIYSQGEIKVTGFINESYYNNGSLITVNEGSVNLPFVLKDFRGGSYMYAAYMGPNEKVGTILGFIPKYERVSKEVSPFNQYQFRNISSKLKVDFNGEVFAYCNLYAGDKNNFTLGYIVGSGNGALIQYSTTSSYMVAHYNPSTEVCDLDFYGGFTMNAMSLDVSVTTVNMSSVYFPVNCYFNISLNAEENKTASYTLKQKIKMLPGSVLTIGKNVTAEFANINVYDKTYEDTTDVGRKYPKLNVDAVINVEGTMICDNLGGNIKSQTAGASVQIKTNYEMTTYETIGTNSGSSVLATIEFKPVTFTATFNGVDATKKGTYTYNGSTWTVA